MSRRAEQYELDERAKARARVNQSPITEATNAHSMAKVRARSISSSDLGSLNGLVLLETVKLNQDPSKAYTQVLESFNETWKAILVKRRFDQSQ
jgi:hypothetical protein